MSLVIVPAGPLGKSGFHTFMDWGVLGRTALPLPKINKDNKDKKK